MDLLHLVDRLEELIAGAQKMPIGNRAIVDRRRMLDLIDQMRVAIPEEVREAQEIVANREEIRREAEEDGRIIIAQAEERAARLTEQHEITQAAHRRAEEIAIEAEQRLEQRLDEVNRDIQDRIQESRRIARQQMSGADDYAREMLQRLEGQLQTFVSSVQSGIRELEPVPEEQPAAGFGAPQGDESGRYDFAQYGNEPGASYGEAPASTYDDEYGAQATSRFGSDPAEQPAPVALRPEGESRTSGELENLLERSDVREVIDDFDNDPLDDDPLLFPSRDEEETPERQS
jgi:F0F1-type ATP synthase membrane subunit b/b'